QARVSANVAPFGRAAQSSRTTPRREPTIRGPESLHETAEIYLHTWTLLPAPAREPLARRRRGPGLRGPAPRLERADHARVLWPERAEPADRLRRSNHQPHEQLCVDELQLRA